MKPSNARFVNVHSRRALLVFSWRSYTLSPACIGLSAFMNALSSTLLSVLAYDTLALLLLADVRRFAMPYGGFSKVADISSF